MKLHNLQSTPGSTHRSKRRGIGPGSGNGKTAGRGHKGQKARSGGSVRHGFESGHIPLYRRLPHRGFNNANFTKEYALVNLSSLERIEGDVVNGETLRKAGLVRSADAKVKILANGEISRALEVTAARFSATAKAKIEKAGGKAIALETVSSEEGKEEA